MSKFTRVQPDAARKLFDDGATIHLLPCVTFPEWEEPLPISKSDNDRLFSNADYWHYLDRTEIQFLIDEKTNGLI